MSNPRNRSPDGTHLTLERTNGPASRGLQILNALGPFANLTVALIRLFTQ